MTIYPGDVVYHKFPDILYGKAIRTEPSDLIYIIQPVKRMTADAECAFFVISAERNNVDQSSNIAIFAITEDTIAWFYYDM